MLRLSRGSIGILALVTAVAVGLSIISYQYSKDASTQIARIAADDVRFNAEIQAHDLGNSLTNKIDSVSTALEIMAATNAVQTQNITRAAPIFSDARSATGDFSSSYFWIDRNGKLLWADAFTNATIADQYIGEDRSFRAYYSSPRDTHEPYYSAVIESVDSVPRLYISYPIIGTEEGTSSTAGSLPTSGDFKGVVAASIDLDVMGKFLESQLAPKIQATTGMIDKNGIILYSQDTTNIGKDIFGPEIQSSIPPEIKDSFNTFLRESLKGSSGSGDFTNQGNTSTLAYQPITIEGNEFAVLYIVAPHQFPGNVNSLIQQQSAVTVTIIAIIGAVAIGIAFVILFWNRQLGEIVKERTAELKTANESLVRSNERLVSVNTELAAANEQLKVNDKMQREFINIAAHELRTPTQAIMGYAELFDMRPEDREQAMKAITRNAERLERLTQDILDVSRIEGKALELHREKFNISDVISVTLEDAGRQVTNGNVRLVYQEPKDIMVEADRARITQVISNLLNNSVKFTKKGTIFVLAEKDIAINQVKVSLVDSGSGIHPEIQPRLFTKFTSNSQTGTGLGLFISKSIVEAHGGTIVGKNNEDGKGATFSFTLPMA